MPLHIRWTLLFALVALLAACPGELPGGDYGGTSGGDMAIGSLGGPCFSDNTCYSGLVCSSGVCIKSSGTQEQGTYPDGPRPETTTPQPDTTPPTPDLPPTPDQKITATGTFGSSCSAKKTCSGSFLCVILGSASTKGYCTKTCATMSKACSGGSSGTKPYCILKDQKGKYYCVFLCKWGKGSSAVKAPCPKDLTCASTENPPGSGQYVCMP